MLPDDRLSLLDQLDLAEEEADARRFDAGAYLHEVEYFQGYAKAIRDVREMVSSLR